MRKVQHERDKCIGCGACTAIYPKEWERGKDGKSDLLFSRKKTGNIQEKTIPSKREYELHQEAAENCPVSCIHMYNNKGEKSI